VVNGGITTTKLTELAKSALPGPVRSVVTRAGRPLFVNRPVTLASHVEAPGKVRLWALDDTGRLAFESVAECA
jgi:hydroxyacyl-ACP dehydratase HTD2-like protein with hotdog domain